MIRFLHAADLHLDSPFAFLPPQQAIAARKRQRQLPMDLVRLAHDQGCRVLLLCGDVFDGADCAPETLQALQSALGAFRGRVFIAPGNHDPYGMCPAWDAPGWPENVHIFKKSAQTVVVEELGLVVYGGAFTSPVCREPLPVVPESAYLQLGVFHAELALHGIYRPIPPRDAAACGLDYLALGHIHKRSLPRKQGGTWVGWPGVTMGRGFDEEGACGALVVELSKERCAAAFVPLDVPIYETVVLPVGEPLTIQPYFGQTHCRLRVVGRGTCDADAIRAMYEPHFLSLTVIDETEPARDLWADCGLPTLRGKALQTLRSCPDDALAALSAAYLLAALEGREAP